MPTVTIVTVLVLIALVTTVLSAMQRCPLYVPVLFLCIVELLRIFPLR